ncbi:prolactin-releasing peptide receptor-like [Patiria miniata]|uniref:G-protein coupled receptors family 1 profile domain-containing protein n=1 Tax=Patiria miniata TaxID=46514 RepID=A0A914BLM0_PATMI|nr:prolactin-releasing peptide receptor-like [Patiria miniata]
MEAANRTDDFDNTHVLPLTISLGVIGILGNGLVCVTIYRARFMHNPTNYLIIHLAFADLLVCSTQVAFQDSFFPDTKSMFLCIFFSREILVWFSILLSSMGIMSVTIERYLAIVHPLHYPRYSTPRRLWLAVAGMWFSATVFSALHVVLPSQDLAQTDCLFPGKLGLHSPVIRAGVAINSFMYLCPMSCLFYCYFKIILNLRRGAHRQRRDRNHAPANELLGAQRRVAVVLAIVATAYIILWLPVLLGNVFITLDVGSANEFLFKMFRWTTILPVINSIINPVIYAFKYKEFQRGVKEAVLPWCFNRRHRVATANDVIALG